jgi:hypothetical protein
VKRDWRFANEKLAPCRICGASSIELANTIGKARQDVEQDDGTMLVIPDAVIPLCFSHHRLYDSHLLNILPYLTHKEMTNAVEAAGGIRYAGKRLTGQM